MRNQFIECFPESASSHSHWLSLYVKLESHVSHLDKVSEEELNRLLSMVVDVENLFTCVHKEEDVDTKQVYFYLFRVRTQSLCQSQGHLQSLRPSFRLVFKWKSKSAFLKSSNSLRLSVSLLLESHDCCMVFTVWI